MHMKADKSWDSSESTSQQVPFEIRDLERRKKKKRKCNCLFKITVRSYFFHIKKNAN